MGSGFLPAKRGPVVRMLSRFWSSFFREGAEECALYTVPLSPNTQTHWLYLLGLVLPVTQVNLVFSELREVAAA